MPWHSVLSTQYSVLPMIKRKTTLLVLFFLALLGGAILAGFVFDGYGIVGRSSSNQDQISAAKSLPSRVDALGRLEPEGGILNIGVGVPMGDRLSAIFVKENEEVKKGQELARLESYEDR